METLTILHSVLRWLLLIVLIVAVYKAFTGMQNKSAFTDSDNKSGLLLTILTDSQLIIGLVLYFMGPWGLKNIQNQGMAVVMKDGFQRFFAVEHILMMLIAIVLIHVGRAKSKKANDDVAKHKMAFWFYFIALVLILASIPWPFRAGFESLGWY
ncbi:MAG: hypothetical protein IPI46_12955 [Bacteroidetes bacterium]|nr:hypothetical protein [Bacteroidota bacterium]